MKITIHVKGLHGRQFQDFANGIDNALRGRCEYVMRVEADEDDRSTTPQGQAQDVLDAVEELRRGMAAIVERVEAVERATPASEIAKVLDRLFETFSSSTNRNG